MNLVVGQLVSNVTFLSYAAVYITPSGDRKKQGNFKCFCGKEFVNRMDVILSGNTKSCGCLRYSFKKIKYNKGDLIGNSGVLFLKDINPSISKAGNRNRRGKFKCKCGNEFEAGFNSIKSNDIKGCGCLHGSYNWIELAINTKKSIPLLYIIKCYNEIEEFIKIGITFRSVAIRFKNNSIPYDYKILYIIKGTAKNIWDLEQNYHKNYTIYSYLPKRSFSGMGECYTMEILNDIEFQKCD